jgi:hypothetical protein
MHKFSRLYKQKVIDLSQKTLRNFIISGSEDTFINVWELKGDEIVLAVSYHMTDSMIFGM